MSGNAFDEQPRAVQSWPPITAIASQWTCCLSKHIPTLYNATGDIHILDINRIRLSIDSFSLLNCRIQAHPVGGGRIFRNEAALAFFPCLLWLRRGSDYCRCPLNITDGTHRIVFAIEITCSQSPRSNCSQMIGLCLPFPFSLIRIPVRPRSE